MAGQMLVNKIMIEFMHKIVEDYDGNYLEIGCYDGVALKTMSLLDSHAADRRYYGIDPFLGDYFVPHGNLSEEDSKNGKFLPMPEQRKNLYENISDCENITFFETTSEKFLNSKTNKEMEDLNVTTVFIDGCHHREYIKIDCMLAVTLIGQKRGAIIFDDMEHPEVSEVVREFLDFLEMHRYNFKSLGCFSSAPDAETYAATIAAWPPGGLDPWNNSTGMIIQAMAIEVN